MKDDHPDGIHRISPSLVLANGKTSTSFETIPEDKLRFAMKTPGYGLRTDESIRLYLQGIVCVENKPKIKKELVAWQRSENPRYSISKKNNSINLLLVNLNSLFSYYFGY